MANNDSLLTLLQNVRNNQELYMKQQWNVAYLTFLLYAAIISSFELVDSGRCFFIFFIVVLTFFSIAIIWALDSSIKRHQQMAEDIYDLFPPMREIVGIRQPRKKLLSIVLTLAVTIGMVISVIVLFSMS